MSLIKLEVHEVSLKSFPINMLPSHSERTINEGENTVIVETLILIFCYVIRIYPSDGFRGSFCYFPFLSIRIF